MDANEKGRRIADAGVSKRAQRRGFEIEVVEIFPIEGGVECFVRAWKDGSPVGFVDGTVELERFRIFNPPVLVDDPDGDILREWVDGITGTLQSRRLREDPQEALLQVLEHNLSVMKGIHGPERIVPGKRGHTTSTFYSSAGTVAPVDGVTQRRGVTEGFSTIRSGAGTHADNTSATFPAATIQTASTSDSWQRFDRGIFGFDTSSIDDADVVSSATFSLYGVSKSDNFSQSVVIDRTEPASPSSLAAADYNIAEWEGIEQAARMTIAAWNTAGYNDFALNSTGRGNVSKASYTWLGTRLSADFDNVAPAWVGSTIAFPGATFADQTGTTQDPKLVVEHAAASASNAALLLQFL